MKKQIQYVIGIMSGTSMDGVDAVLVHFEGQHISSSTKHYHILGSLHQAMPSRLRESLKGLQHQRVDVLHQAAVTAVALSEFYAQVVLDLCQHCQVQPADIAALGVHGQTIYHRPMHGYSWQLINGAQLAEMTGICVITDFRNRDIAAGGQGAPLIPAFHHYLMDMSTQEGGGGFLYSSAIAAFLNIGGMANISLWQKGSMCGTDSGPGNILLDAWIQHHYPEHFYDADGHWAAEGTLNLNLLSQLLEHPYFVKPRPKSCGYEEFNLDWLRQCLASCPAIDAKDVQRTLVELTVSTIRDCLEALSLDSQKSVHNDLSESEKRLPLFVFGGGVYNRFLWQRLCDLLPNWDINDSHLIGIPPLLMEATAFAWLAYQTLHALPNNSPEVTGASGPRILGAIYPA